jgi:pimeloyl-ACP methyl ester carboxylesterase
MQPVESIVPSNGVQLCVQRYAAMPGLPARLPVLLIMGLGMQGIAWPESIIEGFTSQGHEVVTFDNRDIGLSSKLPQWGKPNLMALAVQSIMGFKTNAGYNLTDMAKDTLGLLDALKWQQAHVVGVSMGGMIAQTLAVMVPQRVASLSLIMTSSGSRRLPQARLDVRLALIKRAPRGASLEQLENHSLALYSLIGSPSYPQEQTALRARIRRALTRSYHPLGVGRQLAAIIASGSRAHLLQKIGMPTLVLHGEDDPLVPVAHGKDLAKRISHSRLCLVPGMGHDLPPQVCDILVAQCLGLFIQTPAYQP